VLTGSDIMQHHRTIDTTIGRIVITEQDGSIIRLTWADQPATDQTPLLDEATSQLLAFFAGDLQCFDLPIAYHCTAFQQQVCEAMCDIPYGSTMTYGELAARMETAAQPVGNACGGNPVAIIVPCHRVLGSKDLGGYSGKGGIETKISLLRLEGAIPWLI